jgi:WD40 repeat protein
MSAPTEIVREEELRMAVAVPDHTLRRVIGRGSYGEVWDARNVMGTPRAVKVVRRQDFDSARPFEREFEGIQRYEPVSRTHAGLVQVLHVGKDDAGACFYYVMELADNASAEGEDYIPRTLRGELQRRRNLPVEECIEIGITLASALGHLHKSGLVHRDVKPSNIIFVDGVAKLADVGLVAQLSDSRSMVGTEGYFAPEGTGQPRSDVFSLGKVLYECVTGQDRMNFPDIPESWNGGSDSRAAFEFMEIVLRAAESNPDRRYADTDEMLADLALLKAGKSLRYLRRMETRLKRTLQVLAFASLGIAAAGGAWFYERLRANQIAAAEQKATQAEAQTKKLLGDSLLAEARAVRLSRQAGARTKALDAVQRALAAGAPLRELRTQAASALALMDAGGVDPERSLQTEGHRVMWSPDGEYCVVAARWGGRTEVRERAGQRVIAVLETKADVHEVSISPRAEHVALLHNEGRISVWNTAQQSRVWESPPAMSSARPSFSADGKWIVYGGNGGLFARSCDGSPAVNFAPGAPVMRGIYVAPSGKWVAALPVPSDEVAGKPTKDLGLRIYTGLPGGMPSPEAAQVKEHRIDSDIRLEGVSISADSRFVAAAVSEDRLRVWEVPSMAQIVWLRGHQRTVRGTAFHPFDSNVIASTSWDGTTRLWDIATRQEIMNIPAGGEEIMISPARGELLLRRWDRSGFLSAGIPQRSALRVYNIPPHTPLGLFANVIWNPDGSLIACAGAAGVIVWDVATGLPFTAEKPEDPMEWRYCIFHPKDGSLIISGVNGLYRRTITRNEDDTLTFGPREEVLGGFASFLKWSGDHLAVSGRFDAQRRGGVALLPPQGGAARFLTPSQLPDQLAASPDGRRIAVARYPGGGGTIFDLSTDPPAARDIDTATRADFNFSADSRVLITGTEKEITFTNPDDSSAVAPPVMRRHVQEIPSHSAVSAAAGLVAVTTSPTEVTLLDGTTFEPILTFDSPLTPFDTSLAFSPDGRHLALAGGTSRVMIWDVDWIREELTKMGLGW